jgi:mono/diheme cytochrome c family protein
MAQRIVVVILICLIVLPLSSQQPNVPRNQAGRPGYFHFITLEQAERQASDIQRVNESLMRLGGQIAAIPDEQARQQMMNELVAISTFVRNVEERQKPAGITAAEVERQLTAAKGEAHCGTCHGANSRQVEKAQTRP